MRRVSSLSIIVAAPGQREPARPRLMFTEPPPEQSALWETARGATGRRSNRLGATSSSTSRGGRHPVSLSTLPEADRKGDALLLSIKLHNSMAYKAYYTSGSAGSTAKRELLTRVFIF